MHDLEEIKKGALASLKAAYFAVLATADASGRPHAAAVLIDSDDDFTIYFMTRETTTKHGDIAVRPEVALTVGMTSPIYLQIRGKAERITDKESVSEITKRLAKVAASVDDFWPPLAKLTRGEYAAYRVKPESVKALDMTDKTIRSSGFPIATIL